MFLNSQKSHLNSLYFIQKATNPDSDRCELSALGIFQYLRLQFSEIFSQ